MEGLAENGSLRLKEWAMNRMEYIPRVSNKGADLNCENDFQSRLYSGRLGVYWQYLVRHARSRAQVQHIRDNLKIQEFQDAKHKKGINLLSTTIKYDDTIKLNKNHRKNEDISTLTFELDSSAVSDRSLLLKDYDDTKHLLRKSIGLTRRARMDVECRVTECNELKTRLHVYETQIDQNYETLKFLSLLTSKTKESIKAIKHDVQTLENTLQTRFDYTKNRANNRIKENEHAVDTKRMIKEILEKSQLHLYQVTKSTHSSQRQISLTNQNIKGIQKLVNSLLFSRFEEYSSNEYYRVAIMIHEEMLLQIRSIIRHVDQELIHKDSEIMTGQHQLEAILDEWREEHVTLAAKAKTLSEEMRVAEKDVRRQGKQIKTVISEVIESDAIYDSNSKVEMTKLLHNYFLLCEKRARIKSLSGEITAKTSARKLEQSRSQSLKALVNLSTGFDTEIDDKMGQINRLLQRNGNMDKKVNWIVNKMHHLLNFEIKPSISQLLPLISSNELAITSKTCAKNRTVKRLNNFSGYPSHLDSSLNICGHISGRDVNCILENVQNLLNPDTCSINGTIIIVDFIKMKVRMKQIVSYLEHANFLKEKGILIDEKSDNSGIEEKVQSSKNQSKLIQKLEEVIIQVKLAQKHFGMAFY